MLDDQASTKIRTFNQTLASSNGPIRQVSTQVQQMQNQVTQSASKFTAFNSAINSNAKSFSASLIPIKQQGNALTNLQTNLAANTKSTRLSISALKDHVLGMGVAIAGAISLATSFNDLRAAQIKNDKAQVIAAASTQKVVKIQEALNKMQREGKTNTTAYAIKLNDLKIAQERAGIASQRAELVQDQYNETLANFATQIIPQAVSTAAGFTDVLQGMGLKMSTLTGGKGIGGMIEKFKGLGTSIGGLGGIFDKLQTSVTGTSGSMKSMAGTVGVLTFAVVGAVGVLKEINAQLEIQTKVANGTIKPLEGARQELDQMSKLDWTSIEGVVISIAKLTGGSKALADILKPEVKRLEDLNNTVKTIPPSMNALADSSNAIVNRLIVLRTQLESGKIGITQYSAEVNKLALGDKLPTFLDLVNQRFKESKTALDATVPSINKVQSSFGQLAKTWETEGGKMATITDAFGAKLDTLKQKFLTINAAQKDLFGTKMNPDVLKFFDLLSKGNVTAVTKTVEQFKQEAVLADQVNKTAKELNKTWEVDAGAIAAKNTATQLAKAKQKLEEFNQRIAEGVKAFSVSIGIKDNSDKLAKDILDNIDKKLRKPIKTTLQIRADVKAELTNFNSAIATAATLSEKQADGIVKGIIKTIDEKFKGSKGPFAGLRAQLDATMKDPNTVKLLNDTLLNGDYTATGTKIGGQIGIGVSSGLKAHFSTPAFTNAIGDVSVFLAKAFGGDGKGNVITIPAPVIPAPITTTFDSGMKTALDKVTGSGGFVSTINAANPAIKVNITGATKSIDRLIGSFGGWFSLVQKANPMAKIDITGATKSISRLIGNFNGYVKAVEKANPKVKIDISGAVKSIDRLIGDLNGIPNITRTVTIKQNTVSAQGGFHSDRLSQDTLIFAHKGESADIGSGRGGGGTSASGSGNGGGGRSDNGGSGDLNVTNIIRLDDREILRSFRRKMGTNRFTMGP